MRWSHPVTFKGYFWVCIQESSPVTISRGQYRVLGTKPGWLASEKMSNLLYYGISPNNNFFFFQTKITDKSQG